MASQSVSAAEAKKAGQNDLDRAAEMVAEAKEEIARMMAAAKAEAAEIVKAARTETGDSRTRVNFQPAVSEERVKIKLFKDSGKYSADVFVGVNGVGYQIKRGVTVEVPKTVADILEQSMEQDEATAMMIDKAESEYQKSL